MKLLIIILFSLNANKSVTCTDQAGNIIAHKCSVNKSEITAFIKSMKPAGPVTDQSPMFIFSTSKAHSKCNK